MEQDEDPIELEIRYYMSELANLQEAHQKAIKPIVDRIVRLKSLQPQPPIYIPAWQLEHFKALDNALDKLEGKG